MRRLAAVLALCLSSCAFADDEDALKKKVAEFLDVSAGGQDWQKQQKLALQLRRQKGAVEALIAEACARPDLADKGWSWSSAAQPIVEGRRAEAVEPLRRLLKDTEEAKARFAISLVESAGLAATMAEDLIPLFTRNDVGGNAMGVFNGCRDERAVSLLVEAAGKKGEKGDRALAALSYTGAAGARDHLKAVASDAEESSARRVTALNGLSRDAGGSGVAIAIEFLKTKDDNLVGAGLGFLVDARAKAPAELLKPLRQPGQEWHNDMVDKLLSLAGDEEAAKKCLSRGKSGTQWDKAEWYQWAGRSGLKSMKEDLEKAFGEETDEAARMSILVAIGDLGDPASIDLIARYLTHPEQGWQAARAMVALVRRTPESMDGVLDRLVDVGATSGGGLDSFHYTYLEKPTTEDRVRLVEAYLRLLDRVATRPRVRVTVVNALTDMCKPDFGMTEEAVGKWKAWWEKNKADFSKQPPKHQ